MDTKMKLLLKFLTPILLLISSYSLSNDLGSKYTQKEILKNWTLSRCLGKVYNNPMIKNDANSTASAFLEFSKQPIETFYALDSLAEKYTKLKYTGEIHSNFNTMKCIDLFYSQELSNTIDQQLSKKK
ncbi:MAG: hypothetical protein JSR33_12735 [Proteobacteria bacterium]|nr:hypothetical protein [Pseudomonadota bacterium]